MGIFEGYRQRRAVLSAPESVETLTYMEEYFLDGKNWAQGVYQGAGNTRCLVGAAEHVRTSSIDNAKHWLREAILERTGGAIATIEEFNDRQESFEEVAAVIARAKQLATSQSPTKLLAPTMPVATIPPARLASPTWDAPEPADWSNYDIDATPEPYEEPPMREPQPSLRHKLADWWD